MSDTADAFTSKQTPPGCDVSSPPPPYTYQEQQPPAYSAASATYSQPKIDTPCSYQPSAGYESFRDINPEAASDTTPLISSSSFDDKTVRRGFIRKVFSILILQLLFTFSVVCVFTFSSVVKKAVQENLWAYLSSFIVFIVVTIILSFCKSFSRRHPWNIMALVVVTLSLSYMVGTVASFHNTTAVVITMGVTLAISFAIIAFSAQTVTFNLHWSGLQTSVKWRGCGSAPPRPWLLDGNWWIAPSGLRESCFLKRRSLSISGSCSREMGKWSVRWTGRLVQRQQ